MHKQTSVFNGCCQPCWQRVLGSAVFVSWQFLLQALCIDSPGSGEQFQGNDETHKQGQLLSNYEEGEKNSYSEAGALTPSDHSFPRSDSAKNSPLLADLTADISVHAVCQMHSKQTPKTILLSKTRYSGTQLCRYGFILDIFGINSAQLLVNTSQLLLWGPSQSWREQPALSWLEFVQQWDTGTLTRNKPCTGKDSQDKLSVRTSETPLESNHLATREPSSARRAVICHSI